MENNKNYKVGLFAGISSAIIWGLDTVVMVIVLTMSPFLPEGAAFLAPFITGFFHDAFSALWTFIYLAFKRQLGDLFKAMKTRSALFIALAGAMGGPVGIMGYVLAIKYIGPSYTAIISSLYPALSAVLAYFLLKEKITKKGWLGLLIAISAICLITYSQNESGISVVGIIWALVCVFGWGCESVICAIGMKKNELSSEFALQIRQLASGCIYAFFIIPIVGGIGLSFDILRTNIVWCLAAIGLLGTLFCLFYYKAIYEIGATKATGLNITYVVFSIIFDVVINGSQISLKTIICSIVVMVGVYFVIKQPEEKKDDISKIPDINY